MLLFARRPGRRPDAAAARAGVYLGSLLGLLAVFAVGVTINGAHAWIVLGGGFEMQPAEFMKLGLIVGMAVLFAQRGRDRRDDTPPTAATSLLALGLVAVAARR